MNLLLFLLNSLIV